MLTACLLALLMQSTSPVPPLLARLGSRTCAAREAAQRELVAIVTSSPGRLVELRAGLASRDPEIAWRTSLVIRSVAWCPVCGGEVHHVGEVRPGGPEYRWACTHCRRTGLDRAKVPWLFDEDDPSE